MEHSRYLTKIEEFMLPFLKKNGYELIKSEFVSEDNIWYLRLYIDLCADEEKRRMDALMEELSEQRESMKEFEADEETAQEIRVGIDINDCAKVSRYLSKWLDKEDFITETYTLEVCSKGFLKEPVGLED